jgi:acetylornithine deacetylase
MISIDTLYTGAVALLQELIALPSFSKQEEATASCLQEWLTSRNISSKRYGNNIVSRCYHFDEQKPTLLLNSHHDTVKPATGYTRDPFYPGISDDKLYGLGSNDAGGALVSLAAVFHYFYKASDLPYNLLLALTAEEEISGPNGISAVLPELGPIDCAIVGEPTLMNMAIAERGLLVLDCEARGISGHAARNEGSNAIYKAMEDIGWMKAYNFEKVSDLLGPVSINVTTITTGNVAHNVVPDSCRFAADIRLNELYSHEEIISIIQAHVSASISPRSTRLRSSIIPKTHPLVRAGSDTGLSCYGSPTLSDKALMPFPALKLGPGDSARSHTADEFIYLGEIKDGIEKYITLITALI